MSILIDGHNLIPKLPGMSLADFDDEQKLIEMLQVFARLRRKKLEVFFDKAPVGHPHKQKHGTIQVSFAPPGQTADEEIRLRLQALGAKARQYMVVSSDHRVQTYARAAHAKVENSETFARQVQAALSNPGPATNPRNDQALGEDEVAMWLEIFRTPPSSKKP